MRTAYGGLSGSGSEGSEGTGATAWFPIAPHGVADTVIIPMWDWLELGSEARINTPPPSGGNWLAHGAGGI